MSENGYRNLKKTNKLMIPVILMMGFVPLLVHMYSYNSNLSQFDWFPANSDTQTDFFFCMEDDCDRNHWSGDGCNSVVSTLCEERDPAV